MSIDEKKARAENVNAVLIAIASCGRGFFRHGDRVAKMEADDRGRVWHIDAYTQRRIYTHYYGRWRGFTNGGTLQDLVCHFRNYISKGTPVPAWVFGPWPPEYCNGDLWGYGDDMDSVRCAARRWLLDERKQQA